MLLPVGNVVRAFTHDQDDKHNCAQTKGPFNRRDEGGGCDRAVDEAGLFVDNEGSLCDYAAEDRGPRRRYQSERGLCERDNC